MAERGKKSLASLSVAQSDSVDRRLHPPGDLTPAQRVHWVTIVNSRPAEWFGPENAALLSQYVRHKVQADVLAQQIESFNPAWLADDSGLKRYETLTKMQQRESGCILTLMRSMRLTQQSMYDAQKAAVHSKKAGGRKPWESD